MRHIKIQFFLVLLLVSPLTKVSAAPARCSQWKEVSELVLSYRNRKTDWSFEQLKIFEDQLSQHLTIAGYKDVDTIIAKVVKKHKDVIPSSANHSKSKAGPKATVPGAIQSLTKTRTIVSSSGQKYKYKLTESVANNLLDKNSALVKELEDRIFPKESVVRSHGEIGIKQLDTHFFEIKFDGGHRVYGCKRDGIITFTKWVKNKKHTAYSERSTICDD